MYRYFTIPPSRLRRATSLCTRETLRSGVQHIFNEDTVAPCRIIHKHMGHGTHQFAILNNRATAHADVKYETKEFCVFLRFLCVFEGKRQVLAHLTRDP